MQSIRRVKKYFDLMLIGSDVKHNETKDGKQFYWRLNFLTFTFPAGLTATDNVPKAFYEIRRMLGREGVKHYVWRKELQQNGREHLHLVANVYIHYSHLQTLWNRALCLHCPGSINAFEAKHGHRNPPTTEVRAIRNLRQCRGYFVKYFSKAAPKRKDGVTVTGNTFGVSQALAKLGYYTSEIDSGIERALNNAERYEVSDLVTFHRIPIISSMRIASEQWQNAYKGWLQNLKNELNKQ